MGHQGMICLNNWTMAALKDQTKPRWKQAWLKQLGWPIPGQSPCQTRQLFRPVRCDLPRAPPDGRNQRFLNTNPTNHPKCEFPNFALKPKDAWPECIASHGSWGKPPPRPTPARMFHARERNPYPRRTYPASHLLSVKCLCAGCCVQIALCKLLCASCSAQVALLKLPVQVVQGRLTVQVGPSCSEQISLRKLLIASWCCASCSAQVGPRNPHGRTLHDAKNPEQCSSGLDLLLHLLLGNWIFDASRVRETGESHLDGGRRGSLVDPQVSY